MTVTDLIKKLQQYQQIGQIASVRIEFGDGSIYNDPRLERRSPPRPTKPTTRKQEAFGYRNAPVCWKTALQFSVWSLNGDAPAEQELDSARKFDAANGCN